MKRVAHAVDPSPVELQAAIALAALIAPLNSTMLAIGLLALGDAFEVAPGTATLLVGVYILVVATMQPVAGRFGDVWGTTRAVVAGLVMR